MGRKYRITSKEEYYFVTFTVVKWINIFVKQLHRDIIVDSIKFCQRHKGLKVGAWVLMTNHLHLIIASDGKRPLSDTIRDMKRHTSSRIKKYLFQNHYNNQDWVYPILRESGLTNNRNKMFQLWQQHNHPIELSDQFMFDQRINYIHENPVKKGLVRNPEDWVYSSAGDFYGYHGLIPIDLLDE